MATRLPLRLDEATRRRLELEAGARQTTASNLARDALERYLDCGVSDAAAPSSTPDLPAPPGHDLEDCAEALVSRCLPEMRAAVIQACSRTGLPPSGVVGAVLTSALAGGQAPRR